MYKRFIGKENEVFRESDTAWIPRDINNTDFLAYLEWVANENNGEEVPLE